MPAVFVHQQYLTGAIFPRFEGWWGTRKQLAFNEARVLNPWKMPRLQVSNSPSFSLAPYLASLEMFAEVAWRYSIAKGKPQLFLIWSLILPQNRWRRPKWSFENHHPEGSPVVSFLFLIQDKVKTVNFYWKTEFVNGLGEPNVIRWHRTLLFLCRYVYFGSSLNHLDSSLRAKLKPEYLQTLWSHFVLSSKPRILRLLGSLPV